MKSPIISRKLAHPSKYIWHSTLYQLYHLPFSPSVFPPHLLKDPKKHMKDTSSSPSRYNTTNLGASKSLAILEIYTNT